MEVDSAGPVVLASTPTGSRRLAARVVLTAVAMAAAMAAGPLAGQAGASEGPTSGTILRVGTSGDYAPFSLASGSPATPSLDAPQGFDIDLARRFAKDHGYRIKFVPFRWPDLTRDLQAGRFDVAMSGITLRPERSVLGRFSIPVAATHAVALAWKGTGVRTFHDLDVPTRRIAVNAGGHLEQIADRVFRRARVVPLADNAAVRMALLDRTFDAVVTDNYEEAGWTEGVRDLVRIAPLTDDRKACFLPADRADLAAELDRWLLAREEDGTLTELRRLHFGSEDEGGWFASQPTAPPTTAQPLSALAAAVVERLALMPLVFETKKRQGLGIRDRTRETAVLDRAVAAVAAQWTAAGEANPTSGQAQPTQASRRPPADQHVRSVFEALMAMGRDAQQALAELDARRHPPKKGREKAGDDEQAAALPPKRSAKPVYDLSTQLRPAIGRITDKIAVILVALASMDEPVSARQARASLGNALAPQRVDSAHVAALADAVAAISSGQP